MFGQWSENHFYQRLIKQLSFSFLRLWLRYHAFFNHTESLVDMAIAWTDGMVQALWPETLKQQISRLAFIIQIQEQLDLL